MVSNITPSALQQRVRNGLSDGDASAIERNISTHLASGKASEGEKRAWQNWSKNNAEGVRFDFSPAAAKTETSPIVDSSGQNFKR
jgi:hypothetical protein